MGTLNSQNASITHVAARARVSTATVSRVLSGRRSKDDDIARRVRKAAEELNYSANYAASVLRSDTTNTIGIVLPSSLTSLSAPMLSAVDEAARNIDKLMLVRCGDDTDDQSNAIEDLIARNVDGILVIPAQDAHLSDILEHYVEQFNIVQIAGPATSFHINWVGMDQESMIEAAINHLAEHNANAIAYLSGTMNSRVNADLFANFQTYISRFNLMTEPHWTTFGELTAQRGFNDVKQLFNNSSRKPNALVCANDSVAVGALIALQELGFHVPQDVQLIGFGDYEISRLVTPAITTIRPPYQQIAREALRLLATSDPHEQHWLPAHTEFRPEIIRRASTSMPRMGTSNMSMPNY